MTEHISFQPETRTSFPTAPLKERGLNTKRSIIEDRLIKPDVDIEETSGSLNDIFGKLKDLRSNRRKFISRGFIGTAMVMSGAAAITRGSTEAVIVNHEEIVESPKYLRYVPEGIKEIPEYVEAAVEYAPEIPEETKDFIVYTSDEIAATKIDTATCPRTDGEVHEHYYINIPFSDIDPCVGWEGEDYANPNHLNLPEEERKSRAKSSNAKFELGRIGVGLALAGLGTVIVKSNRNGEPIDRRKLIGKVKEGAIFGVIWTALDGKSISQFLPLPGKDN